METSIGGGGGGLCTCMYIRTLYILKLYHNVFHLVPTLFILPTMQFLQQLQSTKGTSLAVTMPSLSVPS